MIEFIYQTLTKFGYAHRLHPTLTHVPIGMVMGAFLFVLGALIFRRTSLAQSARHCSVLALVVALPTAFLGIIDWLHFFRKQLQKPLGKMPPFGHLLPEQVAVLIAYLKTL
jgi:uncharacterized membrane protein